MQLVYVTYMVIKSSDEMQ